MNAERLDAAKAAGSGAAPPSDAAILAIASSVGMPSSTGANTLILFARALLAACAPCGVQVPNEPNDDAMCAECGKTWGDHHGDLCPILPRRFRPATGAASVDGQTGSSAPEK